MTIALFDAWCGFGGRKPGMRGQVPASHLADEMKRLGIGRALAHTAPENLDIDELHSNAALRADCELAGNLVPCPVILQNTPDLVPYEKEVSVLLARGVGAVCIRPKQDAWSLADWSSGGLFRAPSARRVPVFCKESEVSLEQAAELAARHPDLPIILTTLGYRSYRTLLPLLQTFPNISLAMGHAFSIHGVVEHLVATVGPERILFGTNFPDSEPMAAVTQLLYAGISDADKALIGSGNIDRLLKGVLR